MRKTIYAILTAVVTLIAVTSQSVYADRHGYDQDEYEMAELMELLMDIRKQKAPRPGKLVKVNETPKATVIKIDVAGAHLPNKQAILFVGPINDDYFLVPFHNSAAAKPHMWLSGVYRANYYGALSGKKVFTVQVRVKDPGQHNNIAGTPHDYVMLFEVEDANGPKSVAFSSPVHEGTGGAHGGGAHGNR